MPPFDDPLHDFPDRAIRRALEDPHNLRDLLVDLAPDLARSFDFEQREILPRTFLLDDWQRREADMFFRLPFQDNPAAPPALVCLLLEHQSQSEPAMPLRTLLYGVLHWQEEWKEWEAAHPHGDPLRLTPIIPIVFHTGVAPWRTHRAIADLIESPPALRAFAPEWPPLFWDLAARLPEQLMAEAGHWLVALAVVRAERTDEATFHEVFDTVLRRLEELSETERVRWHELLRFVLSWALRRRPGREREALMQTARQSQTEVAHREEVARMSETLAETWEQELVTAGVTRGQLQEARTTLQMLLEDRFGALPASLAERIKQIEDLEHLRAAIRQVSQLTALSDLRL